MLLIKKIKIRQNFPYAVDKSVKNLPLKLLRELLLVSFVNCPHLETFQYDSGVKIFKKHRLGNLLYKTKTCLKALVKDLPQLAVSKSQIRFPMVAKRKKN